MAELWQQLLHLSWSATVLALAVMAVRLLFRRMPKRVLCLLWLLVALRLVIPFSVQGRISLQPTADPITTVLSQTEKAQQTVPTTPTDAPQITTSAPVPTEKHTNLLPYLWLCGVLVMLGYLVISYLQLYRRVAEAVRMERGVYSSDAIASPFVLGLLRPRIYLPCHLPQGDREVVLQHERCHIRRGDHWIKPLAFLLLSVYWFNPVLWAAYLLLCRDIEGACDERVLADMDTAQRADYSRALVSCATERRWVVACPVAFGEVGVKERVKHILSYKKPTLWVILLAIATCILLAVCFMTDKQDAKLDSAIHEAVLAQNDSGEQRKGTPVEDHRVFQVRRSGDSVTVYAMVLYEELLPDGTVDCGAHNAAKLTFTGNRSEGYTLQEYWIPKDGNYYASSIRENFPIWLWYSAMNTQGYIARQEAECLAQASEDAYDQSTRDAMKIYNKRTPYIGDNAAVIDILDMLGAGEYGNYTVELTTDKEPYGITLHYRSELLSRAHIYEWANRMQQVAWQTLALVQNAQWVKWEIAYPDGDILPGGIADVNDTVLRVKEAYDSLNDFMNLKSTLEIGGGYLPDGRYTAKQLLYLADDQQDPGWENKAVLTQKTTVDGKIVNGAPAVTVTLNWGSGEETLHNASCISTFDDLPDYEIGGISPDASHRPEGMALLAGDGADSGLRIWTIGDNYFMGRVDERGNTLYVYRCELTE